MNRKFIKVDRDLAGQKNHLLTAIRKVEKNKRWYWECLCECGSATIIREDYFVKGKTKSCGCIGSRNSIYKINQKAPGESAYNSHFNAYKNQAKKREINFLLTKEYFFKLTQGNCFYCNAPPKELSYNKRSHGLAVANGIDRINSKGSYNVDNCVTCCKYCNTAKASLTHEEFCEVIKKIFYHLNLGEKNES